MRPHPPTLRLLKPDFDSPLLRLIIDLEKLRDRRLSPTTPSYLFVQLKEIFHMLESLGSARIEGNRTTILDLVESQTNPSPPEPNESLREILNMDEALNMIDARVAQTKTIDRALISDLHKTVVSGLSSAGEGDPSPGAYRSVPVKIARSEHIPPEHFWVSELMDELFEFIKRDDGNQYHLMKIALAHHAYTWIHPFRNGNGRTVRLLTYSMLIKQRFSVNSHNRILNPTAIFCNNRDTYYSMLSEADSGTDQGIESWCIYVLDGLNREINKVDKLADFKWLREYIWLPALHFSEQHRFLSRQERVVLEHAFDIQGFFKAGQLEPVIPGGSGAHRVSRSRIIKNLIERRLLRVSPLSERLYAVNISKGGVLLRGITEALRQQGFIPDSLFQN